MNILFVNHSKDWEKQHLNDMKQVKVQKEEINQTKQHLEALTKRYQKLYKEKNGAAKENLSTITQKLFTELYNYDTDKQTIEERKKRISEYVSEDVLKRMFPSRAETHTQTAQTISKLTKAPTVYFKSSDSNELLALIEVHFEFSVGGGEVQRGAYLYQITYDQFNDRIIGYLPLADIFNSSSESIS